MFRLLRFRTAKQIEGFAYSKTYRCWHLPYTAETYKTLKQLFDDIRIDNITAPVSETLQTQTPADTKTTDCTLDQVKQPILEPQIQQPEQTEVKAQDDLTSAPLPKVRAWFVSRYYIKAVLPYNAEHVAFIKTLQKASYDKDKKCWFFAVTARNIRDFQNYFKTDIIKYEKDFTEAQLSENETIPTDGIVLMTNADNAAELFALVPYNPTCVALIKQVKNRRYSHAHKCWVTDASTQTVAHITELFTQAGYKVYKQTDSATLPELSMPSANKPEKLKAEYLNIYPEAFRPYASDYYERPHARRYSWNTIKSYTRMFYNFAKHFEFRNPKDIAVRDIERYISDLVLKGISESAQIQIISAVKFYYTEILHLTHAYYQLPAPRKSNYLPEILAFSEVVRIFAQIENLKHKSMVYMGYAAGMRISEVVSIQLKDLDF